MKAWCKYCGYRLVWRRNELHPWGWWERSGGPTHKSLGRFVTLLYCPLSPKGDQHIPVATREETAYPPRKKKETA